MPDVLPLAWNYNVINHMSPEVMYAFHCCMVYSGEPPAVIPVVGA